MQKSKDANERFGALPVFPSQYPKVSAGIAKKVATPMDIKIDTIISVIVCRSAHFYCNVRYIVVLIS